MEAAWILTLEKRGSWDFMQKAMSKRKSDALFNFDIYGTRDLLMLEAKVAFESAKREIEESSVELNISAEIVYKWESAVFKLFDEARRIMRVESASETMKDELYSAMVVLSKQLKEYEKCKAGRDAFTKYRNSLEAKSSLLRELREVFTSESDDWKGLSEWKAALSEVIKKQETLVSDCMFAASVLTYFGPFSYFSRKQLKCKWMQALKELNFATQEEPKVSEILGEAQKLAEWHERNLLRDETSIENAFILESAKQWSLIIDPEGAASKWLGQKNALRDTHKYYKDDLIKKMTQGSSITLHISGEEIDEDVMALVSLAKERKESAQLMLPSEKAKVAALPEARRSDIKPIDVHPKFAFVFCIEHSNPVFGDDVWASMNVVNFSLSPSGLQDQFVIEYGAYIGDSDYSELILNKEHRLAWDCRDLERRILEAVNKVTLTRIDSEEQRAVKDTAQDLARSLEESRKRLKESTEEKRKESVDKVNAAVPLASRAAVVYECVCSLVKVNPTYLFTFKVVKNMFVELIKSNYEQIAQIQQQGLPQLKEFVVGLANKLTNSVMVLLEQSMFRSDYLSFAFYLAANLQLRSGQLKEEEWMLLLHGTECSQSRDFANAQANPLSAKVSAATWNALGYLEQAAPETYKGLCASMASNTNDWTLWLAASNLHISPLPIDVEGRKLRPFQRLLVIRLLCPEGMLEHKDWAASSVLGEEYFRLKHPSVTALFKSQTKINRPLLIIKDEAANPELEVMNQEEMQFNFISLTQENYTLVKKMLDELKRTYDKSDNQWFFISNIHLFPDFGRYIVGKLKDLTSAASDSATGYDLGDKWFRLVLAGNACRLPRELLMNSTRLAAESPSTMKQKVLRDLRMFKEQEEADEAVPSAKEKYTDYYRRLLFSLSLLHAAVEKRNVFGHRGWINPVSVTPGEMDSLSRLCLNFLDASKDSPTTPSASRRRPLEVSWTGVQSLVAKVWLGGQIAEDYDLQTFSCFVCNHLNEHAARGNYAPEGQEASKFHVPGCKTFEELIIYGVGLPEVDDYRLCEMSAEASLEEQHNELAAALKALQRMEDRRNEGVEEVKDEMADAVVMKIVEEMPEHGLMKEDINPIILDARKGLLKGLNMYVLQEMERYNSLIRKIQHIVGELKEYSTARLPDSLERLYFALASGYVPEEFTGYPWRHPVAEWVITFKMRIEFVRDWLKAGEVKSFWLRALMNPKGLFNALLVHSSQRYGLPIESLSLDTRITAYKSVEDVAETDSHAYYLYGLYMMNAKINGDTNAIDEFTAEDEKNSTKDFKFAKMPIISVTPRSEQREETGDFACPLYYLPERTNKVGPLQNYLAKIECPSALPASRWIAKQVFVTCTDPESNS